MFFLCHDFNKMHLCWFLENETAREKSSPGFGKYVVALWRSLLHFLLWADQFKVEHTGTCMVVLCELSLVSLCIVSF